MSDTTEKSGDKPIEHTIGADSDAVEAEKKYAEQQAQAAQDRLYTGDSMTYTEYDAVGKGPDYEPSDEIKASLAAKDQAVEDAAADVNNLTPEEREQVKQANQARRAEARSKATTRIESGREKASTKS